MIRLIVFHSLEQLIVALKQIFQIAFGWIVSPSSSLLTILVSQYLNAFCLLRGLIKKPATETVLQGFAKKNLFLINITRGASPLRWSWEMQWDRTGTNCSWSLSAWGWGWSGERRGLDTRLFVSICLLCVSSDGWVIGCDLLLRSCSDFQGEQNLQTP